jgi:predicted RNase H-like HicB family nuclease
MKLLVTLEPDETGMLVAECPSIPGCISQGRTEAEALDNIREAIVGCLETRVAHGMPLTIAVREVDRLICHIHWCRASLAARNDRPAGS